MSLARIAKDQQVAAAVLRDKDPEWFQAQETGQPNTARKTRRANSVREGCRQPDGPDPGGGQM